MFYIHQIGEFDCGITALKILLANLFQKEDYLYLQEDENHGPYSLFQLIDTAKEYGVTLSGVELDNFDFEKYPKKPFLAVITLSEDTNHLVYVHKVKKNSVTIFDPVNGKKTLSKEKFLDIFTNQALIVEEMKEIKEVKKKEMDVSIGSKVFSTILQILSYASLVTGMLFISNDSYIFIPLICFSLYVILQIFLEKYLTYSMKKVDSMFFEHIEKSHKDTNKILTRLAEYKKTLFTSPIKLTGDIITFIFLSAIMIINEKLTAIILFTIMFLLFIDIVFVKDYMKKKEEEVALMEKELHLFEETDEFLDRAIILNDRVYSITMGNRALRYISLFLILLSVFITMMFAKIVSVPFILVHFIFGITIFDKLKDTIYFDKDLDKKKIDYMKLVNLCKE